jgi:hypothetical protein
MLIAAENGKLTSAIRSTSTTNSFRTNHNAPQSVHYAPELIRFAMPTRFHFVHCNALKYERGPLSGIAMRRR